MCRRELDARRGGAATFACSHGVQVHALRALIEKEKSDVLRYSIATMAALSGLGLGVIRLMM